MKVQEFIGVIRRQLSDDVKAGCAHAWSDAQIMDAINEATCFTAEVRPDLFEEQIDVEVSGGDVIKLPDGYQSITRVTDNLDPVTKQVTNQPIEEVDGDRKPIALRYAGLMCSAHTSATMLGGIRTHKVEQARPIGSSKTEWKVSPPVPAGSVATIRIVAVATPKHVDGPDASIHERMCRNIAVLKAFVLMRMFETDTESAYAADHARRYQEQVNQFLGVAYRQQAAYQSGWWLGQTGEGDDEARKR